jgi:hypothetical protein
MALSIFDISPSLAVRKADGEMARFCGPKACGSSDDALWAQFLGALDADSDFAYIAAVARKWRSAGMRLDMFLREMIASFEACEQSDRLDEVFDLSERDGWNIGADAIEAALDRIQGGASAAEAYEYAKAVAGRDDDSKPH